VKIFEFMNVLGIHVGLLRVCDYELKAVALYSAVLCVCALDMLRA
jgi:hypothetical protein